MSDSSSKKASDYFKNNYRDLQFVLSKIKQLDLLNKKVATYLDPTLIPYCQVANLTQNRLILLVANGSVATQLRFQTHDLIQKFKTDPALSSIQDIQCKVRPQTAPARLSPAPPSTMPSLSSATAETILQIVETLEDEKLKLILQKIAAHTTEKD